MAKFFFICLLCHLGSSGKQKRKSQSLKRKKTTTPPQPDEMPVTSFPCPGCDFPLEAREWGEDPRKRTEVLTPTGWVLIKISGENHS